MLPAGACVILCPQPHKLCWGTPQKEVNQMGITISNKAVNTDRIACDGTLKVTLALTATPDIVSNPTDIALVLDRSGSMAGTPLANMKLGAKTFIDIISESTGGQPTGEIGSGSHIASSAFPAPPCRIPR